MATLESSLVSSPRNMMSAFSPYTEFSLSPNSPARSPFRFIPTRNSADSGSLRPNTFFDTLSALPHLSPNDVGPSPVTSTGTETTDIDDEEVLEPSKPSPPRQSGSGDTLTSESTLKTLNTSLPPRFRSNSDEDPTSVIHAPEGYGNFGNTKNTNPPPDRLPPIGDRSTPTPYDHLEEKTTPTSLRVDMSHAEKETSSGPLSPPPITTDIAPVKFGLETATPRAQTRQEIEALTGEKSISRSNTRSSSGSLQGIPEDQAETEEDDFDAQTARNAEATIDRLQTALHECWTLCNTLASLSSIHRERIFSSAGKGDVHEQAWKCCWKLCQELYNRRDQEPNFQVRPTLDLCRDFCQALFDVRLRDNELADSVLRVSFELNNHLYNTHDRTLPEAFRERTLDFYITLCHRLMKQRSGLAEETDSLLRACWSLAEMLFSLRQNRRECKPADEELLGSAVQACWELCDLFREGWTQVRPDRGTPRPSQTQFPFDQITRSSFDQSSNSRTTYQPSKSSSLASLTETAEYIPRPPFPETPTTEFEDTPMSPEDNSPLIPNILVLGTENSRSTKRWSSGASTLSQFSQGSNKTSSTATTTAGNPSSENIQITRLKILILKAAMNVGYDRSSSSSFSTTSNSTSTTTTLKPALSLQTFIKSLPTGSFGSLPWHTSLLSNYKQLVLSDPVFMAQASLPAPGKRASASDVGKSCLWMMGTGQYGFLRDLFRLVFGFHLDECESRKSVSITV